MKTNNLPIDHRKTAERCRMINRAEIARQCSVSKVIVHHVVHGTYPYMQSEAALRVLEKLKELNLVVYLDNAA